MSKSGKTPHIVAELELNRRARRIHKKLVSISASNAGIEDLELPDIVDIRTLQLLMDHFQKLTGMVFAILDLKGTILVAAGWQDICTRFHRVHADTARRCLQSDIELTRGVQPGKFKLYHCKNHMWDVATPLIIGGKHMGNLFMGQFLFKDEEPDRELFRQQARDCGFDEEEYLAALDRVPRWSRETLDTVMNFYSLLADIIGKLSYGNIKLARAMAEKSVLMEQLEASKEKAERANRVKSEFLANMSHEIRTPLNGILGMLQLLQTTEQTDEQQEYLLAAVQSSKRLTRLLSDILDISRIEAGQMQFVESAFDFFETQDSITEIFRGEAQKKGLGLELHCAADVPRKLIGDEARLRQILFNVVGNAIKFTDTGSVRVATTLLPAVSSGQVRVLITICDTGIGISEENLKKIFDPFVQVEGSYTRHFQGAGLGLSIVRRLVSLLGGSLAVDSTVGKGSTFSITLPFKAASSEAGGTVEAHPPMLPAGHSFRILFADDDDLSLMSGQRMFEKLGYAAVTARNGLEVLQLLSAGDFDLIIIDIQMPVMDGVEAARMIRNSAILGAKSRIPIIAMTAYAMSGDREKFLAAGIDDYISKPVDMEVLREVVERVMAGKARPGIGAGAA